MTMWNLSATVTLDRAPNEHDALRVGQLVAGDQLLMVAVHEDRLAVHRTDEWEYPGPAMDSFTERLEHELTQAGYSITRWEAVECLSAEESERRLSTASVPPMVSAAELAEMCGVSKQRIYELETSRSKAAAEGTPHPFPTPVVPGWWLRSAAQRYAQTRKRRPGPVPRSES